MFVVVPIQCFERLVSAGLSDSVTTVCLLCNSLWHVHQVPAAFSCFVLLWVWSQVHQQCICYETTHISSLTNSNTHVPMRKQIKLSCQHLISSLSPPFVLLSHWSYLLLCSSSLLAPSPTKAIQVAHCRIIPQPLRHAGLVRLIVVSGFTLTTEVKASKNIICKNTFLTSIRRHTWRTHLGYKFIHLPGAALVFWIDFLFLFLQWWRQTW